MSNKSGTSSQVISLPQGGGAQHGIGEKFSPDLHTGTGNFTVPIALPSGRSGFQPQVNLAYSTGNGNGAFGFGWGLSVPGVSRTTSKGIPLYDDLKDTFLLSGAEDLVLIEESTLVSPTEVKLQHRYRPRTEGLFARINHYRIVHNNSGAIEDYWEVQSKDGLVSIYGSKERPPDANEDWQDPAVIVDPDSLKRAKIFAWELSRTLDPFGNRIDYLYERDANRTEDTHHWDQLYLSEIRYVDHGDRANPQFLVTAKFRYEERPDRFSEYRPGFEIRTVQRCSQIEVFTHAVPDTLTRSYHLIYLDKRGLALEQLPVNGVSLLSRIKVVGHDGAAVEEMPPLEFSYTCFQPSRRDFFPITGPDLPPGSLARSDYEQVALFGNGLPDILEMNGMARYWRNLGNGTFDRPRDMGDAPAGLRLSDSGVQLMDANGDGRADLLVTTDTLSGYFPLRFTGLWNRHSFKRYKTAPSFNLEDPEVKLIDLDGDGVTDAIRSSDRLECFFNDPEKGWNETRWVERPNLDGFPGTFSDPRVKWGDITGDGLQDVILVYDGNIEYWPNLGYGNWAKRIHMKNSPRFPDGYNPRRILVGDVDGDGLADIVYVDDTKVTLWINQSGNGWSEPIVIEGTPPVSDMDAVRLADMLGAGISGVLWSADAGGLSGQSMFFLDFSGGIKPYLLNEMNNQIGAVTRVAYAPSTRFYLEDQKRPETRWKTSLPFPVQVVLQVEVIDEISKGKLATEYRYHHGYWDGAEREFRGFGRVDQFDTELFVDFNAAGLHPDRPFDPVKIEAFSPPTWTRTWFHQGPIGDEFGDWEEADFSGEFWPEDPQILVRPSSMTELLKALPRRVKRDALRALRGSVLRTELYALDGTERLNRPYTVTESLPGICAVVDQGDATLLASDPKDLPGDWRTGAQHQGIFFPTTFGQRTTQWERGDDPLTQFAFTDDYDTFGQARRQTQIACPRGWRILADTPNAGYLAKRTRTSFSLPQESDTYIVNRVARTTTYELTNKGGVTVESLRDLANNDPSLVLIGQGYSYYDGPAFQGLSSGAVGAYGALVRTESLVLTEEILHNAYRASTSLTVPPEEPPYLARGGVTPWTAEYPAEFQAHVPALAGYSFHAGGPDLEDARGFFTEAERRSYDFQSVGANGGGRGLVEIHRDPLGRDTQVAYDNFDLLPVRLTDPARMVTRATHNYRVLQPKEVTDPNGNQSHFTFSPLGLLKESFVIGKPGEGDQSQPGVKMDYDFLAFANSKLADPKNPQPIFVHTTRRVHHDTENDVPVPERDATIESREYSDGFGRVLQTRSQAEDVTFGNPTFGDAVLPEDQNDAAGTKQPVVGRQRSATDVSNVVVSGWQFFDNKGRVVEKYEPFYSTGFDFIESTDAERGQKIEMFYDPRGQMVRTVNPDGSEQRVILGVPGSIVAPELANPDVFQPTPWEAYAYDANDNSGRTHPAVSIVYRHHQNTPTSTVIDALGRTVRAIERNRDKPQNPGDPLPPVEEIRTVSTYDIRGNVLTITDALGRLASTHAYDLSNRPLRIESIDAGIRRTVLDAAGDPIESRDSKGALVLRVYDALSRPTDLWARDVSGDPITLRERTLYGDDPSADLGAAQLAAGNLLGKPYRAYDEAGRLTFERYDFKGNLTEKSRRVISDNAILSVFNPPPPDWNVPSFRVDWQLIGAPTLEGRAAALLDLTEYRSTIRYDALNRVKTLLYPQDVTGARKELKPRYNRAGALEGVSLDDVIYVAHIAYNARGQRSLIAYGNGVMTRHAHDAKTFRLLRLRTERFAESSPLRFAPSNEALQDFSYTYDLAGNIMQIRDRTPAGGLPNSQLGTDALDRDFVYDPLYRLLSANGRECGRPPGSPWDDPPRCTDLTRTRSYTETYNYDAAGNLKQLAHTATRVFELVPNSNRLATVTIGQTVFDYTYDANGNLVDETTSRHFEWDHSDRLRVYRTQTENAGPSVHVHHLYDTGGQRVKKLVRRQGGQIEVTAYIDGVFEHHRTVRGGPPQENNSVSVMDNLSRIALVRVGQPFADDSSPAVKYYLADHLGSSNVMMGGVAANVGDFISREEYTPYGETCFGSFARKRYRFTGKERDEESGLYYFGARYYAPWFGKWLTCDPGGFVDGINLYVYARGSPVSFADRSGLETCDPQISSCANLANTGDSQNPSNYARGDPYSPASPRASFAKADSGAPNMSSIHTPAPRGGLELAGERLSQAESEVVPSLLSRDEEWAQRVASDAAERFAKHAAPAYDMSHVLKSMDPNNLGVIRGAAAGAYMLSGQGAKEAWQHANVVEAVVGVGGAALMLSPHAPSNFQAPTEGPGTVIEGSRFSLSPPKATLELAREIANVERGAMRTSRTIVLIETNQGKTFVSGGGSDLSAGQVALAEEKNLTPVAPLPGIHAEGKGILGQHMLFCEPTRGVSTNKICAHCETDYIRPFGGTVLPGRFEFRF